MLTKIEPGFAQKNSDPEADSDRNQGWMHNIDLKRILSIYKTGVVREANVNSGSRRSGLDRP